MTLFKNNPFFYMFVGAAIIAIVLLNTLDKLTDKYKTAIDKLVETEKALAVCETEKKCSKAEKTEKKEAKNTATVGVYPKHLRNIIDKTLVYLGVENRKDWERLLYLTALVESDGGVYTRQLGCNIAKGFFQLEEETERDILRWLKVKHPELYNKIKNLRIKPKLEIHEAEYNLAYATSLAYAEYFRRKVNPKGMTTLELAKAHKKAYNTYAGKATVEGTMSKLQAMNIKL